MRLGGIVDHHTITHFLLLPSKDLVSDVHRSQYCGTSFREKKKLLVLS